MRYALLLAAAITLAGCALDQDVELQKEPSGFDKPAKSPCACVPLPYDAPTPEWRLG